MIPNPKSNGNGNPRSIKQVAKNPPEPTVTIDAWLELLEENRGLRWELWVRRE